MFLKIIIIHINAEANLKNPKIAYFKNKRA